MTPESLKVWGDYKCDTCKKVMPWPEVHHHPEPTPYYMCPRCKGGMYQIGKGVKIPATFK